MHTPISLKAHLTTDDRPGLALDIDDVLCVTGRVWYDAFIRAAGDPGISFEDMVRDYSGGLQLVPGWKDHPAIARAIHDLLYSRDYHLSLLPIANAKERVWDVHALLPIRAYVTMRSLAVLDATKTWLRLHGFPEAPILSRPLDVPLEGMHAWKASALHDLFPHLVGIVDDDTNVLKALPVDYSGTFFLFGGATSLRTDINIIPCRDWDEVYAHIQDIFKR